MGKLKVIHIVPFIGDEASGPAYSVPALCSALSKLNCEVVLYTLAPLPERKFDFRVEAFSRSSIPTSSFGFSWRMYKSLSEDAKDADIIHNHSLWMAPNIFAGFAAKKANKPLINSPRGTLSSKALERSSWKKSLALKLGQRFALNATECFHVTAQHEQSDVRNYQNKTPSVVIPNGIDLPSLKGVSLNKEKTVLFLGRIHPIKGLDILLKSWKNLGDHTEGWQLKLVGKGDQKYVSSLANIIEKYNIDNIQILDPVYGSDKNVVYQKASIYVLPSYSENFGMTVVESLSNATPVITTNKTPWEDLQKKGCGWCIEPSEEELTKALLAALSLDELLLKEMGGKGRIWMEEEFSWKEISKKMLSLYQELKN
ncbi:glycosyltransferase [Gramella sp. KN1008]|uniref:glycosyltransferase n=1 Tax=Gramella sp. KN1008 TaxID=2529298 RepID=UPI00103F83E6|nr:glycosyltransferase [Gramella sp. KN1008]TBW30123.1 glycosyltransferase [Gramella sp. KN1008]